MPPLIQFVNPIRIEKLTRIFKIRGVDIYFHWSVLVISGLILLNVARHPGLTLIGLAAWLGVLLIHETGHLIAAHRVGCSVFSIEIYPIYGVCRFAAPRSRFDHCIIAWGGVLAQLAIAGPLVLWVVAFGYSEIVGIDIVFAILGFFSIGVAIFNLLPIPPLDGATAWALVPALFPRKWIR
jgi:Zn-dependent protease